MTLSEYARRFIGEPYEWPSFSWCEVYVQAWMEYYGMTEKKTFDTKTDNGSLQYANGHYFYDGHEFPVDDWDMEVTFTKKVKPIVVGSKIRDSQGDTAVVLAVDGDEVWLKYYGNYDFRATGTLDECTAI